MPRSWSPPRAAAAGLAALCLLTSAACAPDDPDAHRPPPTVTAGEVEQRLKDHFSRLVTAAFDAGVTARPPVLTRTPGCGEAGPSWGVTPRAELTVTTANLVDGARYYSDATSWLQRGDFPVDREASDFGMTSTRADGVRLHGERSWDTAGFTLVLTGPCAWPPDRSGGPAPAGRLAPLPPPPGPATASIFTGFEACGSPKAYVFNVDADPYAGPGPHPITALTLSAEDTVFGRRAPTFLYEKFALPDDWGDQDTTLEKNRTKATQLVACVRVETREDTGRDVTCQYRTDEALAFGGGGSPYTFDVFTSVYLITMREARTGKEVGEITIPGTLSDEDSCPSRMTDYARPLALGLDEARFERELRPYRENPR
jgi:hypothetical protein